MKTNQHNRNGNNQINFNVNGDLNLSPIKSFENEKEIRDSFKEMQKVIKETRKGRLIGYLFGGLGMLIGLLGLFL